MLAERLAGAMNPDAFRAALEDVGSPLSSHELLALRDHLHAIAAIDARDSSARARVVLDLLRKDPAATALAHIQLARAHRSTGSITSFVASVAAAAKDVIAAHDHRLVSDLRDTVVDTLHGAALQLEPSLEALRDLSRVLDAYGMHSERVELLCGAADRFGAVGAFPAAFRALSDAQDVAHLHGLLDHAPIILELAGQLAFESGDLDGAEAKFEKLVAFLEERGEATPPRILANLGTTRMARKDYAGARAVFTQVLQLTLLPLERYLTRVHLAACEREAGETSAALSMLEDAEADAPAALPLDTAVETQLISAKCFAAAGEPARAGLSLFRACDALDSRLAATSRLHFRRGIRERFASRFRHLLGDLPSEGATENVSAGLACLHGSQLSDWLALLDWSEACAKDEALPGNVRTALARSLEDVIEHGAPVLHGFREKYDDPFEGSGEGDLADQIGTFHAQPWRDLTLAMSAAVAAGATPPFHDAGIIAIRDRIHEAATRSLVVAPLWTTEHMDVYLIAQSAYMRVRIASAPLLGLAKATADRGRQEISSSSLAKAVAEAAATLRPVVTAIIGSLQTSGFRDVALLPDRWPEAFPLFAALVESDAFRARVVRDGLSVRRCPIARKGACASGPLSSGIGLWDSRDGLRFAAPEIRTAQHLLDLTLQTVDLSSAEAVRSSALPQADLLHVATHGVPLSRVSEPALGSLRGLPEATHDPLSIASLQHDFHRYRYRLAVLNACYGALESNRNHFREFKTAEHISTPSLLLANRRSQVVSAMWPLPDVLSFTFSHELYRRIAAGASPRHAFTQCIVALHDMSASQFRAIVETIDDGTLRERYRNTPVPEHPFRNPFCYGGFVFDSLW